MDNSPDIEVIDGTTFELRPLACDPTNPNWICMRKNRDFTNRYLALADEFKHCRMVEVGVGHGGSTSFFTKLLRPHTLLAIELSKRPVARVMNFLARHDPEGRVTIHSGVDQSDRVEVPRLVDTAFKDQALDLIIDDASHLLAPTTATFEMLFPRLRPGGLYIIEDWSWVHVQERHVDQAINADPEGKIAKSVIADALDPNYEFKIPMSTLICQLVIASGRNPEWITEVRVTDGFCEIRRGGANISPGTPIASYVGCIGTRMFHITKN